MHSTFWDVLSIPKELQVLVEVVLLVNLLAQVLVASRPWVSVIAAIAVLSTNIIHDLANTFRQLRRSKEHGRLRTELGIESLTELDHPVRCEVLKHYTL